MPMTRKPVSQFFVEEIMKPIQGTNRNITMDNWFTSVNLVKKMLECKLTCVGTMKKNKREIPPQFINVKGQKEFSSQFAFDKELTLLSYVPKKNKCIILLSSMHEGEKLLPNSTLPEIIQFYNETKGGVDMFNQMSGLYSTSRKTRRWPLCLFYGMLNTACLNAYILMRFNVTAKEGKLDDSRQIFLMNLGEELLRPWMFIISRLNNKQLPRYIKETIGIMIDIHHEEPEMSTRKGTQKRCHLCPRSKDKKIKTLCSKCGLNTCSNHSVTICQKCFEK